MTTSSDAGIRSENAEERRLAVASAPTLDHDAALQVILLGLADTDWRVRKEGVSAALLLEDQVQLCDTLREAVCQGENVGLRNAALEVFARLGHAAVNCLMHAYRVVSHNDLKFIIEALGSVRDPAALPLLVEATRDDDSNVVASAIDALARIGGADAEAALTTKLQSSDPFERMAALDGLARVEAPVAWEVLEPLLEDRLVRRVALSVLGRCGSPQAVAPLIDALTDPSAHFVAEAAVSLGRLCEHSREAREAVGEALQSASQGVRAALRMLAHDGSVEQRRAATLLLLFARDDASLESVVSLAAEGELTADAQEVLRDWGVTAVGALLDVAGQGRGLTSGTALEIAADLAQLESLDPKEEARLQREVRSALADHDSGRSVSAARSMVWFASGDDAEALVEAAQRGNDELARAAAKVLGGLVAVAPKAVLTALREASLAPPAGPHLIRVLASARSEEAFELLQSALSAESPETRAAAVDALGKIGGRTAAELVGYAMTDESPIVQVAAAGVLGKLRDDAGALIGQSGLMLGLESDVPAVQSAAARALGEAGEPTASAQLKELTFSNAPGVAFAAITALRSIAAADLPSLLLETLGHEDEEVVKQALRALAEVEGERRVTRVAIGLVHPSWDVRSIAARLLGGLGSQQALDELHARLEEEDDPMVKHAISEALGEPVR